MAKAPKPKALPVTSESIGKAAQTGTIKDLVKLADAFHRVGILGPFKLELPLFCSMWITEKAQYRRGNVTIGAAFNTDRVSLGKKQGLIFAFTPAGPLDRNGEKVERIEIGWDDIVNNFADLADQIEEKLGGRNVAEINDALKAAIARNPSMHAILTKGFDLAQVHSKEEASSDQLEEIPGFGMF
jgi:hypothetical protein